MRMTTGAPFSTSSPHTTVRSSRRSNATAPAIVQRDLCLGPRHADREGVGDGGSGQDPERARDPRVSLHVSATDFWSYAVVEGDAELSAVAADPHDAAADELVDVFRLASGKEHEDWEEFRRAMVSEHRQVLRVRATKVYGMAQLPECAQT